MGSYKFLYGIRLIANKSAGRGYSIKWERQLSDIGENTKSLSFGYDPMGCRQQRCLDFTGSQRNKSVRGLPNNNDRYILIGIEPQFRNAN